MKYVLFFVKFVFKIIALPFIPVLMLLTAALTFLHCLSEGILAVLSSALALMSVACLLTAGGNDYYIRTGIAGLVISFLASPVGLPALAGVLVNLVDALRYAVQGFVFS